MCEDTTNTGTLGTQHLCITHRHETNTGSGGCPPGSTSPLTTINHRLLLITVADLHWDTKTHPTRSLKAFIAVLSAAFRLSHVLSLAFICSALSLPISFSLHSFSFPIVPLALVPRAPLRLLLLSSLPFFHSSVFLTLTPVAAHTGREGICSFSQ